VCWTLLIFCQILSYSINLLKTRSRAALLRAMSALRPECHFGAHGRLRGRVEQLVLTAPTSCWEENSNGHSVRQGKVLVLRFPRIGSIFFSNPVQPARPPAVFLASPLGCARKWWKLRSPQPGLRAAQESNEFREPYSTFCCTLLYVTVPYCTLLYLTVPYCTLLYLTVSYCTLLYLTVPHCTSLHLKIQ